MDPRFIDLLRPYLPVLGDRDITEDAGLRELGLDSMHAIDLLFAIEDTFDVSLPDDDLNDTTFETVGSLWHAVSTAQGQKVVA
ncbi:phosphopantetheine-binding protein [Salinispora arenicola]|uniref:phosphopantetheine-binding protein n=1 Tax=Salinispora arenicola TaxID=168697 RepID=UPI00037A4430|nr:phosphopantetheine-binding protein [Salinispora arenicola]NIL58641.1 acyl carrier protein [Salinispora arenicola]NIL63828.1 acyl carrier protein [Salinispora arenicola]